MAKQEAIWAASKLLCNIYHDDSGDMQMHLLNNLKRNNLWKRKKR